MIFLGLPQKLNRNSYLKSKMLIVYRYLIFTGMAKMPIIEDYFHAFTIP